MSIVSLTPELEAFTASCVASGRYADLSEVHCAALRLLQMQEQRRTALNAMLADAERHGEEEGFVQAADVLTELDALISEIESGR